MILETIDPLLQLARYDLCWWWASGGNRTSKDAARPFLVTAYATPNILQSEGIPGIKPVTDPQNKNPLHKSMYAPFYKPSGKDSSLCKIWEPLGRQFQ